MSERMSDERLKQLDAVWLGEVRARRLGAVGVRLISRPIRRLAPGRRRRNG